MKRGKYRVQSRQQAVAIGLSTAGRAGVKVPSAGFEMGQSFSPDVSVSREDL
ncbi:MAG: hypothetical protein KIT40_02475 [Nitrospira sp.]|nr:hypothetical protein [Nitrospira sp.]